MINLLFTSKLKRWSFIPLLLALSFLLNACGSSDSDSNTTPVNPTNPTNTYLMGGSVQGAALNLSTTVTTIAGNAGTSGHLDGTGTATLFNDPLQITTDGTSLYIAEPFNQTIRKIDIDTHEVTTLAGTAETGGYSDGTGTSAQFNFPYGVTTDGSNLYVTETINQTIRKVVIATGEVTTLAGSAGVTGSIDGVGTAALFNVPTQITTDGDNIYVTDTSNHTIRKIVIATGAVTTLAGTAGVTGSLDGTGTAASFSSPYGLTTDGINVYVGDTANHTIRKIDISTSEVTTFAGSPGQSGSIDGVGLNARFYSPEGMTCDGTYLYVADASNSTIRRIDLSTREVTTLAGLAGSTGSTDGVGAAARFLGLQGITNDSARLYVTESVNNIVREVE